MLSFSSVLLCARINTSFNPSCPCRNGFCIRVTPPWLSKLDWWFWYPAFGTYGVLHIGCHTVLYCHQRGKCGLKCTMILFRNSHQIVCSSNCQRLCELLLNVPASIILFKAPVSATRPVKWCSEGRWRWIRCSKEVKIVCSSTCLNRVPSLMIPVG